MPLPDAPAAGASIWQAGRARQRFAQIAKQSGGGKIPPTKHRNGAAVPRGVPASPEVRELVRMSRAVGRNPKLVQGGGGNTSVKAGDGETMVVKASGTPLGKMTSAKGYRRVRLEDVRALLADRQLDRLPTAEREQVSLERLIASAVDGLDGRPSVETALHAVLGRAVCHTHPAAGTAVCCTEKGEALAQEWFSSVAGPPLCLPYVEPGMALARKVLRASERHAQAHGAPPRLILLGNHGVFVSAKTGDEAVELSQRVEALARHRWEEVRPRERGPHAIKDAVPTSLRRKVATAMKRVWGGIFDGGDAVAVAFSDGEAVRQALAHPEIERLTDALPLTPEQAVFAHGQPLWIGPEEVERGLETALAAAVEHARRRLPRAPVAVLVSGTGLFAAEAGLRTARAALAVSEASLLTLMAAEAFGGCVALTPADVQRLEAWEAESFRRGVLAGKGA